MTTKDAFKGEKKITCKHEKQSYTHIEHFIGPCEEYNTCRECGEDGPKFQADITKAEQL